MDPLYLQRPTYHQMLSATKTHIGNKASVPKPRIGDKYTRQTLDFLLALWDHTLAENHYESVLYSSLAAMALDSNGSWRPLQLFTPTFAALKCVSKALVLVRAYIDYRDTVIVSNESSNRVEDWPPVAGVAARVKQMKDRFPVADFEDNTANSTPAIWIHHTLAYGIAISAREPHSHASDVSWVDNFQIIRIPSCFVRMHEPRDFAARLVHDLQQQLAGLLLLENPEDLRSGSSAARPPRIPWDQLQDFLRDR